MRFNFLRKRSFKIPIIALFSLAVLILLTFLFLYALHFLKRRDNVVDIEDEFETYKYLEVNMETQLTTRGYKTLKDRNPEVFEVRNNGQVFSLLSNIEDEEFYCSASCYCEEEEEEDFGVSRRRKGPTGAASEAIVRPLFYLVAAVSTAMALEKATDYFDETCTTEIESYCPQEAIRSDVEGCASMTRYTSARLSTTNRPLSSKIGENFLEPDEYDGDRIYYCEGYCLPRRFKHPVAKERAIEFDCGRHTIGGEFTVERDEIGVLPMFRTGLNKLQSAVAKFREVMLVDFCRDASLEDLNLEPFVSSGSGKVFEGGKFEKVNLCVDGYYHSKVSIGSNIQCIQTYPLPNPSREWCTKKKAMMRALRRKQEKRDKLNEEIGD